MAFDGDIIWIKGFSKDQALSSGLRQIPCIELYQQREGLLFKPGKLVPEKKIPGGLLWNSLQRAFPLSAGEVNHNYFGIQQKISVRIVPAAEEQQATALLTDRNIAKNYITQSAAVRLQPLKWCFIGNRPFFTGAPLLSIPGIAYWEYHRNFIPAGFNFEFPVLGKNIYQRLSPEGENKIIWFNDGSYMILPVKQLVPLTVSSYRLSTQ